MQNNSSYTELTSVATSPNELPLNEHYEGVLDLYGLAYDSVDCYLQVGGIERTQGWILHLSVITTQLTDLFHLVIPELIMEEIPFKIPKSRLTARAILDGNFGYEQVGKIMSIYTESDQHAIILAQKLIGLTKEFKGPDIPTDIHLGGVVYTRYGSFNPLLLLEDNGKQNKYIYDKQGNLIKDPYSIPFQLPSGIQWPFAAMASPVAPAEKKILHDVYKPMAILKKDARGDVIKALYLKRLLSVTSCVIKVGKKNMVSDDWGRDIRDRLAWQQQLHNELSAYVPMPKIIDLFEDNGDSYLAMEYIKGISLIDRIQQINIHYESWRHLSWRRQSVILDYIQKILTVVQQFHKRGFVHRDIAPGNFLITPTDQLVLIDTELAYNVVEWRSAPPFQLGTPGFMSPEQENTQTPTIKEDIYGIGALMLFTFTGLPPIRFDSENIERLKKNLGFFVANKNISELIAECLDHNPRSRPDLATIQSGLEQYAEYLSMGEKAQLSPMEQSAPLKLATHIEAAIAGLARAPMAISDGIWMSKTIKEDNILSNKQKDYTVYAGVHTGIGGVLYLLGRAKDNGFAIDPALGLYTRNWEFVKERFLGNLSGFMPGLYSGAAGLALTIIRGISAGLIEDNIPNRQKIYECLNLPNDGLDLATGVSGQALAAMQCAQFLSGDAMEDLLQSAVSKLLAQQQSDGSWLTWLNMTKNRWQPSLSLSHGMPGVIYFVLSFFGQHPHPQAEQAARKGLQWLLKRTHQLKDLFDRDAYKDALKDTPTFGDERMGVILCFIKAYEVLKDSSFKDIAEKALHNYPPYVVDKNYMQGTGLAALGELYIEAWRVFRSEEWKKRFTWIANVFTHTAFWPEDNSCHWLMEESRHATADLFVGNSGIIHFLMRCHKPDEIGYILLK